MTNKPFGFISKTGRVTRAAVLENYAIKSTESKQITEEGEGFSYGARGLKEPPYPPRQLAQLLELNTYHYRCVKTKARESAGLGWSMKPVEGKTEETADPDQKERAKEFFDSLSDPITQTLWLMMVDHESVGYGAIEVTTEEDGTPLDLIHLPASTVRAHRDKVRFEHRRGAKSVWYKSIRETEEVFVAKTGETVEEYEGRSGAGESIGFEDLANDLMWFRNYTPDSDYYGKPDVMPALGALWGELSRRDYNIAFFDNHGVPAMAVFITGDFDPGEPVDEQGNPDPEGRTPLEDTLEDLFADLPENPHSTVILTLPTRDTDRDEANIEVRFERLATEVKDASFRLYRQDNRDEIVVAHGVPGYRIGINETGSLGGNTARESTEIYKRSVLEPLQATIENEINTYVVRRGLGVTDWEWKLDELDTRDSIAELDKLVKLFENGALSPNELREHSDLGLKRIEHPAMDLYYISGKAITSDEPEQEEAPTSGALLGVGGNGSPLLGDGLDVSVASLGGGQLGDGL